MRKNTKKVDIIIVIVILLLIAGGVLFAMLSHNAETSGKAVPSRTVGSGIVTYKDYIGKRIGIKTGSSFEPITFEYFPDSEYMYFDSTSDLTAALQKNKIDAFLEDEPVLRLIRAGNSDLDYLRPPLVNDDYSFIFGKGSERSDKLRGQFNEMLAGLKESGKLDEITNKWFGKDDSLKTFDRTPSSGENGTVTVAGTADNAPFAYFLNNEYAGYAVELITLFGQKYGYTLTFEQPNAAALIAGATTGVYDIGIGSISVTEERKESAEFSDVVYSGGISLAVRAEDISSAGSPRKAYVSDFNGKTAGVITGSMHEGLIKEKLPDSPRLEFKNYADMTEALTAGKIDYFLMSRDGLSGLMAENDKVDYADEPLDKLDVGAIFAKTAGGKKIREQFDEFIGKIKADGTLESIYEYWRSSEADGKSIDMSGLTGENGTLLFATTGDKPPVTYVANGGIAGTDPDIAVRFCREYGYDIKVEIVDGGGFVPGVVSGVYDFAMADFVVTEERKESVDFSVPYSYIELYVTARKEDVMTVVEDDRLKTVRAFKEVGTLTGTVYDEMIADTCPDADINYYDTYSDMLLALKTGILDSFVADDIYLQYIGEDDPSVSYINNLLDCTQVRTVFANNQQGRQLCDKFNAFLDKITRDGTLDEMRKLWIDGEESIKSIPELNNLDSRNGVLRLATDSAYAPMVYVKDGRIMGLEIDLIYKFCEANGYGLKIMDMTFESIIPAVQTEKCDLGCSGIVMTGERGESAIFSDPYQEIYGAFAVLNDISREDGFMAFIKSIGVSFEKNFIRENRWKLILEGIGTTSIITVLSTLFGSLLAFMICMFRRTGSRLANAISDIYVKLLQGTPIVVLLMILYYVIFGKSGLEAVWVAVIGFSLNFGAYASEIMRSGIESIDGGQREAALALGYSENQAFFRFIFPQAAVRFVPVYKQEIVSLLKSTSIVGYIAIQDLTKMSDIIRSRTYEAFFPLIATAVIYFILAWIIALILKLVFIAFDKRKKRV